VARTIAAHVDEETIARLRAIAATENRSASQIVAVAVRTLLNLAPGARRTLYAIDDSAKGVEHDFAGHRIRRAALQTYERILDARHAGDLDPMGNAPARTAKKRSRLRWFVCRAGERRSGRLPDMGTVQ